MERMWKKIPRPYRGKESQVIGNPVLVESTVDKARLDQMPNVGTAQSNQTRRPPPRSSENTKRNNVVSVAPSVSSYYSQSYGAADQAGRPPVPSSYYGDVSPPDSPTNYLPPKENSGDISPIEKDMGSDIHPAFRINHKPSISNIPVARREVTPNTQALQSRAYNRDPSKPIKWDKYTGEPTTSRKGLPPGVMPGNVRADLEKTRLKRAADKAAAAASTGLTIETRPPWKGGSGRTAIVDPVNDKPAEREPIVHRKQRPGLPTSPRSPTFAMSRREVPTKAETGIASAAPAVQPPPQTMKPVGTTVNHRNQSQTPNMEKALPNIVGAYPSPPLGADERGPPISHRPAVLDSPSRGSSDTVRKSSSKRTDSTAVNIDSRFSWTTQATNTTYQHSPPPTPPPPLPTTLPSHYISPTPNANSVMNRKRPVPTRNFTPDPESPIISNPAPRRKATGQGIRNDGDESPRAYPVRSSSRAPSIASTTTGGGKALPPTPSQLNSSDHVGDLEAQLQDLAIQRNNIQRVLKDLTSPEASNPLKTNFLVERERVKRVTALKDELNEIGMLEHDIGVRLHRANKRRERDEGYEGFTTMWVRRVTS